ncbi:hypothetical protein [Mycobacterium sp.]|uniref:hypothetical protein n=1 Tax=Mycobacterium sp. TaxID=1785 RepID=UPI0025DEFEA3|nr:hypothetical protein [Mycobacterium sp.]
MSAALFDLALRVAARDAGRPVPRLLHNPAPARETAVAVVARRTGQVVRVQAAGPDGRTHSGTGPDGLVAIMRAAASGGGDLAGGPTALIDSRATLRALAGLACSYADPTRCAGIDVAAGSALAGWWVERAAHPGTSAVTDVLAVSRQRFVLGVAAGKDHAAAWRAALSVPNSIAGLHIWRHAITSGPLLPGLESLGEDDDWHLEAAQEAVQEHRSWDRPETLQLAAARLASRCDAADLYDAALLADPLWRARGVHTGFVCHGEIAAGAGAEGNRVTMRADRLDTRLKVGSSVTGWPGEPTTAMPDTENRLTGEVFATAVEDGALVVTIGGLRKSGYRPAAGETVTVIPAPPSVSVIRSRRTAVARLYRRRFSWLSQGSTPTAARRPVPLAVMIAAADEPDEPDT